MKSTAHVAFCGGGSGGHLFPAIAVAEQLLDKQPAAKLTFLISERDIDQRVLGTAALPKDSFDSVRLPVKTSVGHIRYAFAVARSFLRCRAEFRRQRPVVVVGLGGFASIPGVLAAAWLKVPIVLLETNAIPGAANRLLNRFAEITFGGWPVAEEIVARWRGEYRVVGVPLRKQFHERQRSHSSRPTMLILGGSQGASRVNELVAGAISQCSDILRSWKIIHQTGQDEHSKMLQAYASQELAVEAVDFVSNMPELLAETQVVVTRCGAVTLAEIAAFGCSAVLIPLSSSADDHQLANAQNFPGLFRIVDEKSPTAEAELVAAIQALCASKADAPETTVAETNAAEIVAEALLLNVGSN